MKATFIKQLQGFTGDARLYKLDTPLKTDFSERVEYVVVSATSLYGTPETYIFSSDESGKILDWQELDGSFKGSFDHEKALRNAGYEVAPCKN